MKRGLSIAELIRQDVLDLYPEPPRPPCPIPPRLLILACSATKAVGEGLTARDRYQGPLWQTLRAADPDGSKVFACFFSAKFGLGDTRDVLPCYVRVASSWLPDFRVMRQLAADAPVAVINGPIGVMRARLRAWLAAQR